MKIKHLILFLFIAAVGITCKSTQEIRTPKAKMVNPENVGTYHDPVALTIAWFPYENMKLEITDDNNWVVVDAENGKGAIPVIMIDYPLSGDSIWLDMNTDNETLGRLIKHTLMTQEPIYEPIGEYLEVASCSKCHPADVEKGFE